MLLKRLKLPQGLPQNRLNGGNLVRFMIDSPTKQSPRYQAMRWIFGLLILGVAACSNQEAGNSTYLNRPFDTAAGQSSVISSGSGEAERIVALNLQDQQERRRLSQLGGAPSAFGTGGQVITQLPPRSGDEDLVVTLEAAIENAGRRAEEGVIVPVAPGPGPATPVRIDPATIEVAEANPLDETLGAPVVIAGTDGDGISDNSFETVTERESIESDAARLAAQAQANIVLEAEPLPAVTTSANLVAFARSTQHRIGERVYQRGGLRTSASAARTCRQYGNPDEAQRAFLARGGPEADPMRLDPDGDGFVCGWSPDPFRALAVPRG